MNTAREFHVSAISAPAAELQKRVLDAIKDGRLTPMCRAFSGRVRIVHPYEVVNGTLIVEDKISVVLYNDGGFSIDFNKYYPANTTLFNDAAKKMYNSMDN